MNGPRLLFDRNIGCKSINGPGDSDFEPGLSLFGGNEILVESLDHLRRVPALVGDLLDVFGLSKPITDMAIFTEALRVSPGQRTALSIPGLGRRPRTTQPSRRIAAST